MFNKVLPADNGKHKALYHDGPASGMQGNLKDKLEAAGPAATGSGKSISFWLYHKLSRKYVPTVLDF